jgi:hypothetical protein
MEKQMKKSIATLTITRRGRGVLNEREIQMRLSTSGCGARLGPDDFIFLVHHDRAKPGVPPDYVLMHDGDPKESIVIQPANLPIWRVASVLVSRRIGQRVPVSLLFYIVQDMAIREGQTLNGLAWNEDCHWKVDLLSNKTVSQIVNYIERHIDVISTIATLPAMIEWELAHRNQPDIASPSCN